jgi:hypothetical protein
MYVCIFVCVYIPICVYVHTWYIYIHVLHMCLYVYMCVCVRVWYIHVCAYTLSLCVYMYIQIHTDNTYPYIWCPDMGYILSLYICTYVYIHIRHIHMYGIGIWDPRTDVPQRSILAQILFIWLFCAPDMGPADRCATAEHFWSTYHGGFDGSVGQLCCHRFVAAWKTAPGDELN